MAINLLCLKCKSSSKLNSKVCKKCQTKLKGTNRKYRVVVSLPSGSRKSKVVGTLEEARKLEAKLTTEINENRSCNVIRKAPLLSDVWPQYLQWAKLNKKSWIDDQRRWAYNVETCLETKSGMDKITPRNIEVVLETMLKSKNKRNKPYAPQTVKHVYTLIKRVFNWAISRDLYNGPNPCLKIQPPTFDNKVNHALTREDLNRLLSVLDSWKNQRGALVVKFSLYTGKRRGEVLSLLWTDIDLENRLMTFRGSTTKDSKTKTIPINGKAYEILAMAYKMRNCDHVFSSRKGPYKMSGFNTVWQNIRRHAGLTARFHDLRHTYASYLASSGKVDIYTLKELLGHSNVKMTERYAHLINGALRKAACVADEVF